MKRFFIKSNASNNTSIVLRRKDNNTSGIIAVLILLALISGCIFFTFAKRSAAVDMNKNISGAYAGFNKYGSIESDLVTEGSFLSESSVGTAYNNANDSAATDFFQKYRIPKSAEINGVEAENSYDPETKTLFLNCDMICLNDWENGQYNDVVIACMSGGRSQIELYCLNCEAIHNRDVTTIIDNSWPDCKATIVFDVDESGVIQSATETYVYADNRGESEHIYYYEYDDQNNLTHMFYDDYYTDGNNYGRDFKFYYDETGKLVGTDIAGQSFLPSGTHDIIYDDNGKIMANGLNLGASCIV